MTTMPGRRFGKLAWWRALALLVVACWVAGAVAAAETANAPVAGAARSTTFPLDSAVYSGQFSDQANPEKTILWRRFHGVDSTAEMIVTGTSLTIGCQAWGNAVVEAKIDGGAWVDISPKKLNEDTTTVVFEGLADAPHTVTIRTKQAMQFLLTSSAQGCYTVTGQTPTVRAPDAAQGNQYILSATATDDLGRPGIADNLRIEGDFAPRNYGGYDMLQQKYRYVGSDNSFPGLIGAPILRFNARVREIAVWTFLDGSKYALLLDGVAQPAVVTPEENRWGWLTLAQTLDESKTHEYGVVASWKYINVNLGSGGLHSLRTRGGTGVDTTTRPPERPMLVFYGDSITAADRPPGLDVTRGWPFRVAEALGMAHVNSGVSSTTVHHFGTDLGKSDPALHGYMTIFTGEARTNNVTDIKPPPAKVVILYGTNDLASVWVPYGGRPETLEQFTASYRNMLRKLLAGLPAGTEIYCVGMLPRSDKTAADLAPWRGAIATVVAEFATPRLRYVDPLPWGFDGPDAKDYTTNYYDGLHLTAAGHLLLAEKLQSVIAPAKAAAPATPHQTVTVPQGRDEGKN